MNESTHNVVVFSFDLFTSDLNISMDDRVINNIGIFQLHWETVDNSSSGLIHCNVTKAHGFNQTNHTTEGAVTYHFTVDASVLGEGPLTLTLFAKLQCFRYSDYYCSLQPQPSCTCSRWHYEAESETIQISAKKGRSHTHHVHIYIIYIYIPIATASARVDDTYSLLQSFWCPQTKAI